ncbi:kinase-like protein [Neolentinus lepideus HHB14362 ss-1]|uniref:1-phosphatidylinositol 4-kinase n=1 Tax=Neolentinus lepideus HHB14362 ss-1 TaxID=1314782 RepID=A0A165TC83_9AGAM|nr:kinase-like protein [Neolentinus lepideus HHB14362 ss-1]
MTHALLLRLFLSPSFFSVHVALQYLRLYSDNIGITYYLTRRLRELDIDELRDVWGFICHLLVTRPSKSRALECFVVDTCRRSTHIAMLTLWFMQARLRDLSISTRQNPKSFAVCQSTLHQCHEIIFGDLPAPAVVPYSVLGSATSRKKVKSNALPVLVGMGVVMAGVPGIPLLAEVMGEVVIEQGRADDEGSDGQNTHTPQEEPAPGIPRPKQVNNDEEDDDLESSDSHDYRTASTVDLSVQGPPEAKRVLNGSNRIAGANLTRRSTMGAAQTSPALPLHLRGDGRPRLSDDPFGQQDYSPPVHPASPFQSSPSLSTATAFRDPNRLNTPDLLLQKYDLQSQVHLLRSHYCRSEVQFTLGLEDICSRLLVVPKPARVSALRAELTTLNHKLPAEVCMPMWCSSSDNSLGPPGKTQPHHRIVRIPPGESVVLNSAEKAPFLLLVEILHDDLDFDPSKRSNKEVLKKIVKKEEERKSASSDFFPFKQEPSSLRRTVSGNERSAGLDSGMEQLDSPTAPDIGTIPPTPTSAALPVEDEEVDLIEQVYGADGPRFSKAVDLSDSIVLPPRPRNKDLDVAAWSRSSSLPPSPAIEHSASFGSAPSSGPPATKHGHQDSSASMGSNGQVLSLDDYSERMRTAAVMLAQLNANLVREPATGTSTPSLGNASFDPSPVSSSGWSAWFSVIAPQESSDGQDNKGPVHPSLSGYVSQARPSNAGSSGGMRLNPAEAAAIRDRIMQEMIALEEERMDRMRENQTMLNTEGGGLKSVEDESIIRRELNRADPSAVVFSESWSAKKSRIRHGSPYGHLANWDCVSVIVKTGGDLRQEQLAVQLIQQFQRIWQEEHCQCWVRYFRILVTGGSSGFVETITDAVSIHSIKKAEYARRFAEGRLGHVTLLDHFKTTYGDSSSTKFIRAQRNFAKSLAGYSLVTYLLQIKDRHNGNILLDREGHLIHIDFGFMLSNSPGNIGFEAAPFKLPLEYVEVLGGVDSEYFREFRRFFREGFEAASKHCDSIITLVELMQKDSSLPCFAALGEQTANQLRERFQPALTHSLVQEHVDRLIDTSLGSNWTRLYDSYQYYAQSIL